MTLSKILVGNLGRKYAATVNKIGAVSPDTRLIERIKPVIIFGADIGKITLCMVCILEAPNARLASRNEFGMDFKASSVVLITTGNASNPSVNEPAIIESPHFNWFTKNSIPNNPKTIDGIPARLFVIT